MTEEVHVHSSGGSSDTRKGSLENEELNTFLERLISAVALEDVENINQTQKNMFVLFLVGLIFVLKNALSSFRLNKFEKTNEMLVNCNALGQIHFEKLSKDYRKHTVKLVEMHKDLDWIFHRIRFLKHKLKQKYPDVSCGMYLEMEV